MTGVKPPTQVRITLNDGTVETYWLTEPPLDDAQMASRLRHLMEGNFLTLELDDKLLMMPMHNIRSIEVSPAPTKLPDTVIRHVKPLV